jgi:hypothetical protein
VAVNAGLTVQVILSGQNDGFVFEILLTLKFKQIDENL